VDGLRSRWYPAGNEAENDGIEMERSRIKLVDILHAAEQYDLMTHKSLGTHLRGLDLKVIPFRLLKYGLSSLQLDATLQQWPS